MTHTNTSGEPLAGVAAEAMRRKALLRLDHTFFAMRRMMVKPPTSSVPIPSLGRAVDMAKIIGCEAIDLLTAETAPVTVKDVAAYIGLEPSTVSRLLTDLEADGFVRRGTDPADGRRTTLSLTQDGKHVVVGSVAMRHAFMRTITDAWTPEDLEQLSLLLERFSVTLQEGKNWLPNLHAAAHGQPGEPA